MHLIEISQHFRRPKVKKVKNQHFSLDLKPSTWDVRKLQEDHYKSFWVKILKVKGSSFLWIPNNLGFSIFQISMLRLTLSWYWPKDLFIFTKLLPLFIFMHFVFIYNKYFVSFYVYNGLTNLSRSFTKFSSLNKNGSSIKILPIASGD